MSAYDHQENQNLSEEEYLRTEELSEVRREYINSQLFPKTGESFNHNFVVGNIGCNFSLHLKDSPCNTYMLAMLLRLEKDFVYPDVMVDCKPMKGDDNVASSPIILVEVLSETTRKTDCTVKLQSYMKLPTVQEYVIIEQNIVCVLVLRRRNHWLPEYFFLGDLVNFESIGLVLPVEEIYCRVDNAEMLEFRLQKELLSDKLD